MKNKFLFASLVFGFSMLSLEARELTYKFGLGYRQSYTSAYVNDADVATTLQVNGLEATYGVAPDLQVGAFFGFIESMNLVMTGPKIRYDIQRLISRDSLVWKHLNIFTEAAFLLKFGKDAKTGITIHAPYLGFEILPFSENNFAIQTSAGVVFDFIKKNRVGFTNAMFGDVGVKYYF